MNNRKFSKYMSGKGYYIALILCAVAIGIAGYLYYRNDVNSLRQAGNTPAAQVDATDGMQVAETKPGETTPSAAQESKPQKKSLKTAAPVSGKTVAEYAVDCLSYNQTTRDWRTHNGVDIAAEAGTAVGAAADGTVYTVYEDDTMGTTVVIRHEGGYTTKYASLAKEVSVAAGDKVKLGQAIGCVGQTAILESAIGDHVHFSVSCNDVPMNPMEFLSME